MKLLDKISLTQKIAYWLPRREAQLEMCMQKGSIHPLFRVMQSYLSMYYQGICDDPNTRDVLHAYAHATTDAIQRADALIVFWFFWSLDRLEGVSLLDQDGVKIGMATIWGIHKSSFEHLVQSFDALSDEQRTTYLWKLIAGNLGNEFLSSMFGLLHIRNAQIRVLKILGNAVHG